MAKDATYRVPFRRRRKGLTDYRLREKLILSRKIRFIPRRSLKYVTIQLAEATPTGDRILAAASSRELVKKYGWPWSCKNTPAAYLTGLIAGDRALKKGIKEAILDMGLCSSSKGAKIYATVKGAIDAGLKIPASREIMPSDERLMGRHIVDYARILMKGSPESYERQFSGYLSKDLSPESIPEYFEKMKAKIIKNFEAK